MLTSTSAEFPRRVTVDDFVRAFGITREDMPAPCIDLIESLDLRYRVAQGKERDKIILEVLHKLESDTQRVGATERRKVWERGWAENLEAFRASGADLRTLTPRFIRPNQPIRLDGDYVIPADPHFELNYFSVLRRWFFVTYLAPFQSVYEFGCGTGFNLVALAELYPDKKLFGSDFVPSAVQLVNETARAHGLPITGFLFDMRTPDAGLKLGPGSAVLHFGSVEQLAGDFEPFLEFLLANRPALCIGLEPTVELYDAEDLVDYLAIRFHRKRGYTEGYLPKLQELAAKGKIEILKLQRTYFGSLFMEGFSFVIWRPSPS
jgi:SAM-dependent methyltransferase